MREPDRIAWRHLIPRERIELLDYALAAASMEYDDGLDVDSVKRLVGIAMQVLEYDDDAIARALARLPAIRARIGQDAPLQRVMDDLLLAVG